MLVRDINGTLIIISRAECKNESVYNQKLYDIRLGYTTKYNNTLIYSSKESEIKDDLKNISYY